MKKINLLPWREQLRKTNRINFLKMLILVIILTGAACIICHSHLKNFSLEQININQKLTQQITLLSEKVQQINNLREQCEKISLLLQNITLLQMQRNQPCYLFSSLPGLLPANVFLTQIHYNNKIAQLNGVAIDNHSVSLILHNLETASWFAKAKLNEISNNKFTITFEFNT